MCISKKTEICIRPLKILKFDLKQKNEMIISKYTFLFPAGAEEKE
jgi:hypothetical protein